MSGPYRTESIAIAKPFDWASWLVGVAAAIVVGVFVGGAL